MYTVLVKNDNTVVSTVRTNIMHRSSMVDNFRVLVDPTYNDFDMRTFQCLMEYKTPISDTYTAEVLTPLDELYNGKLDYRLPVDTKVTSEVGDVEFKFIFIRLDMDENGNTIERVRKTASSTLKILSVAKWSDYIADAKLDSIAQMVLMNQAVVNQLGAYADALNMNSAESLAITNGKLHLVSVDGKQKGEAVDVVIPRTIDDDGINDGLIELDDIVHDESNPDCDCGCNHDNFEELDNFVANPEVENGNFSEL